MSQYPTITNFEYHRMSFKEIDEIREKIKSNQIGLIIEKTQLFLYLNQMESKNSSKLKVIQNLSIIGFISSFLVIFFNWKLAPLLFIFAISAHIFSKKLAEKYIFRQCSEDRVFLKFALGVGLVRLQLPDTPIQK